MQNFVIPKIIVVVGWQDNLEVCTLTFELSSLGLNLDAAINHHPGTWHAERSFNLCTILWMDLKMEETSAKIANWWTLKIPH